MSKLRLHAIKIFDNIGYVRWTAPRMMHCPPCLTLPKFHAGRHLVFRGTLHSFNWLDDVKVPITSSIAVPCHTISHWGKGQLFFWREPRTVVLIPLNELSQIRSLARTAYKSVPEKINSIWPLTMWIYEIWRHRRQRCAYSIGIFC